MFLLIILGMIKKASVDTLSFIPLPQLALSSQDASQSNHAPLLYVLYVSSSLCLKNM